MSSVSSTSNVVGLATGSVFGELYTGYQADKDAKKAQRSIDQQTKKLEEEKRKRERELANRMATEKARKSSVENRSRLLRDQLTARSKARPRGGTILTKQNPFNQSTIGKKSIIGG